MDARGCSETFSVFMLASKIRWGDIDLSTGPRVWSCHESFHPQSFLASLLHIHSAYFFNLSTHSLRTCIACSRYGYHLSRSTNSKQTYRSSDISQHTIRLNPQSSNHNAYHLGLSGRRKGISTHIWFPPILPIMICTWEDSIQGRRMLIRQAPHRHRWEQHNQLPECCWFHGRRLVIPLVYLNQALFDCTLIWHKISAKCWTRMHCQRCQASSPTPQRKG